MFIVAVVILSVLLGIVLCLAAQYIILKKWYLTLPILKTPHKSQYGGFKLPKEVLDLLKRPDVKNKRETCICLNLLLQFLFSEMRDTKRVRKWIMKRMDIEFEELLQQTTTGKLLDSITVRDFNLGDVFPIIKQVSVQDAKLHDINTIEEVCIEVDLDYSGGFQLAVDVDMVFGKSAYLSVKIAKLVGKARLQMTRIPYTHWTFSFVEEPVIEFEVESQFDGRPIAQLTSLIINQIRKSVRKKHTLPSYKIRNKPFFIKPETPKPSQDIYCQGNKISVGELSITVIQCSRLVTLPGEGDLLLYCSLALDKLPWSELLDSRRKLWTPYDFQIDKGQALNIGLTFKEEFIIDRSEELVLVEIVNPNSPADAAKIKKGDVMISVNGVRVNSSKQAVRLMKQAQESFRVRIERSSVKGSPGAGIDFKYNEDSVSLVDQHEDQYATEDYINISINQQKQQTITKNHPNNKGGGDVKKGEEEAVIKKENSFTLSLPDDLDTQGAGDKNSTLRQRRKGSLDSKSLSNTMEKDNAVDNSTNSSPKTNLRQIKSDPDLGKVKQQSTDSELDLRKTKCVKVSQNPVFKQEFTFQVKDKDIYLNVCVWGRVPEKLDKQNRVLKPEKSILLGHVSIPVMDISLECLTTLQGDYQQTFQLIPPEPRAGASRSKFANMATHRGFDESLCHGDITLAFLHSTQPMSKAERRKINKIRKESEDSTQSKQSTLTRRESKKLLLEGQHDFGYVKFTSATSCDFCHKKIWFKNGFTCAACNLISHKKCMDRCQAATKCSKTGWTFRDSKSAAENAKKAAKQVKSPTEKQPPTPESTTVGNPTLSAPASQNTTPSRLSLLSRFRRGDKGQTPPPPSSPNKRSSPSLLQKKLKIMQLLERQKNSSGQSGSDSDNRSNKDETLLMPSGGIQKTRSSSSIDEMMKNRRGEASDTDSESEMNLLSYYEQQKNTAKSDEMVVMAAKEMGRELYSDLPLNERKVKLDFMINKLQHDIDETSEYRAEQSKDVKEATIPQRKAALNAKMDKTDEKIQSLAVLMLHYCAGLQHCMEEIEAVKLQQQPQTKQITATSPTIQPPILMTKSESFESIKSESKWSDNIVNLVGSKDGGDIDNSSMNDPPELLRLRTETEYLDAKEGIGSDDSQVSVEFMDVSNNGCEDNDQEETAETPEVEFERQLSTALQEIDKSDEEEENDLVDNIIINDNNRDAETSNRQSGQKTEEDHMIKSNVSMLPNYKADYFSDNNQKQEIDGDDDVVVEQILGKIGNITEDTEEVLHIVMEKGGPTGDTISIYADDKRACDGEDQSHSSLKKFDLVEHNAVKVLVTTSEDSKQQETESDNENEMDNIIDTLMDNMSSSSLDIGESNQVEVDVPELTEGKVVMEAVDDGGAEDVDILLESGLETDMDKIVNTLMGNASNLSSDLEIEQDNTGSDNIVAAKGDTDKGDEDKADYDNGSPERDDTSDQDMDTIVNALMDSVSMESESVLSHEVDPEVPTKLNPGTSTGKNENDNASQGITVSEQGGVSNNERENSMSNKECAKDEEISEGLQASGQLFTDFIEKIDNSGSENKANVTPNVTTGVVKVDDKINILQLTSSDDIDRSDKTHVSSELENIK